MLIKRIALIVCLTLSLCNPAWAAGSRTFGGADGDYLGEVNLSGITNKMSVLVWARTGTEKWERCAAQWGVALTNGFELGRGFSAPRTYQFEISTTGTTSVTAATTVDPGTDNIWRFVGGTYDGVNVQACVNAGSCVTAALTGNVFSISNVRIGDSAEALNGWNGQLGNAQFYTRALATQEMGQVMRYPGSITRGLIQHVPIQGQVSPEIDYATTTSSWTINGSVVSNSIAPPINGQFVILPPGSS